MSCGPGWSREKLGCPEIVLWHVLLGLGLVLLDKIRVVGLLKCLSLTLESRQSRQVRVDAMSPLVTDSSK